MSWNYRIVTRTWKHSNGTTEDTFAIHEAYYNDEADSAPHSISMGPSWPQGETPEELREEFAHYARALERPILKYEDFERRRPAPLRKPSKPE